MWEGVSKSGSPISRWMTLRPSASSARARARTSKADSVPRRDRRAARRTPAPTTGTLRRAARPWQFAPPRGSTGCDGLAPDARGKNLRPHRHVRGEGQRDDVVHRRPGERPRQDQLAGERDEEVQLDPVDPLTVSPHSLTGTLIRGIAQGESLSW